MKKTDRHAVIWDLDGTLVDTAELHYQAWVKLAAELGTTFSRETFRDTFGKRNPEIIPALFGESQPAEEVARLGERKETIYRESLGGKLDLLPGVRNVLELISSQGIPQAIGSSAPRRNLEVMVRITGIGDFFGATVACEDVELGKPAPFVFLEAAQRLSVSPKRCLVFEDAPIGVQAARAAGMRCIVSRFVGHHSTMALVDAGADVIVKDFSHLHTGDVWRLLGLP